MEGQERRVETLYPATVTGNVGMGKVTSVFILGKWEKWK